MLSLWKRMFDRQSLTVQALLLLPSYRTYQRTYSLLRGSQYWSREQLEAYQQKQLALLLEHAYENVPYYRRVFDEQALKPEDIVELSDLRLLPFLTKSHIQKHLPDLRARNYPDHAFEYVTTGGSTGIPVGFYYEKGISRAKEWAFMKTQWDRVGYRFSDKCVVLRGNVVTPPQVQPLWKNTLLGRWLIMSSYHMTDEHIPQYIEQIRSFEPKYIQAYPSTITLLARYIREHGIEPFPTLKAILCGSENLYPWQRELLQNVFECRVYSWYGNSEQTVLAGECESNTCYHIFPEYGIVELIGRDDLPLTCEGEPGEVVATGLQNYVCPLIRYRTMDVALYGPSSCGCGRGYPLLKRVEGRLQEFIVLEKGRRVPMTALNMHSAIFDNVAKFQFYQEKEGEVVLKIVRKSCYTDKDTDVILKELHRKLGEDTKVLIRFVDDVPRTPLGKYLFLVQKLPLGKMEA
jgi:phenylacetate-CoA ligase